MNYDYWYQLIFGDIPSEFTKVDADFEWVSVSPTDFKLSVTTTNFDQIISYWYYSDYYDYSNWYVYGPSDLTEYTLPEIPDEVLELFPFLERELYELSYTRLTDHSELNSYYEILEILFESPNLFYDIVNDYSTRVKNPSVENSQQIQNDSAKRNKPYEEELFPGDQMYLHYKNLKDRKIK